MTRRSEMMGTLRAFSLKAGSAPMTRLPRSLLRRLRRKPRAIRFYHRVDDAESLLMLEALIRLSDSVPLSIELIVVPEPSADFDPEPGLSMARKRRDAHELARRHALSPLPVQIDEPPLARVRMIQAILLNEENGDARLRLASELSRALFRDEGEIIAEAAREIPPLSSLDLRLTLEANYKRLRNEGFYEGACFFSEGERFVGVETLGDFEARVLRGSRAMNEDRLAHSPEVPLEIHVGARHQLVFIGSLERASDAMALLALYPLKDALDLRVELIRPFRFAAMKEPEERVRRDRQRALEFARRRGLKFGPFQEPSRAGLTRGYALFALAQEEGRGAEMLAAIYRGIWQEARDLAVDGDLLKIAFDGGMSEERALEAIARAGEEALEPPLSTERLFEIGLPEGPAFLGEDFTYSGLDRFALLAERIGRGGA